jgi:hypothetical protein
VRALLASCAAAAVLLVPGLASADQAVPFNDLQTVGGLALCDTHGHPVSAGNIDDKPFVAKAVSEHSPGGEWSGPGRSAVLYAYQPRKDAYPDQWNGDTLTAASAYEGHPTAVATGLDFSLADYLKEFPTRWDDLVQLRMYWGARGVGFDQRHYASAVLRIDGKRWQVVAGTTPGCTSGKASSTEVTVAGLDPNPTPSAGHDSPHPRGASPASSAAATAGSDGRGQDSSDAQASKVASAKTWGRLFGLSALAIAVAALAVLIGRAVRRRTLPT